jgi:hypothetical protein
MQKKQGRPCWKNEDSKKDIQISTKQENFESISEMDSFFLNSPSNEKDDDDERNYGLVSMSKKRPMC